jgi:hypothetical protein
MSVCGRFVGLLAVGVLLAAGACGKKEQPVPPAAVRMPSWPTLPRGPEATVAAAPQAQAAPIAAPQATVAPVARAPATSWDAFAPGSAAAHSWALARCDALQGNEYTVCKNKADSELATR